MLQLAKSFISLCNRKKPGENIWQDGETAKIYVKSLIKTGQPAQAIQCVEKWFNYGEERDEMLAMAKKARAMQLREKAAKEKAAIKKI